MKETEARAALKALIRQAGGTRQLGEALGCTRQAVESWSLIPLNRLRQTRKLYGLGLKELRPDIYELAGLK